MGVVRMGGFSPLLLDPKLQDAERIYQGVLTSQWVWAGPVVIMVSMVLTIRVLGLVGLVGVGVMVLAMIYQIQSASQAGTRRESLVKLTDERLKLTYVFGKKPYCLLWCLC